MGLARRLLIGSAAVTLVAGTAYYATETSNMNYLLSKKRLRMQRQTAAYVMKQQEDLKATTAIKNKQNISSDNSIDDVDQSVESPKYTSATDGTGLNTLLTASASEGYAKDQLELATLASEGKLGESGGCLPMEYALGQMYIEIGAYPEAGSLLIPRSCFDWNKSDNSPYYYTNLTGSYGGIDASDFRITRFGWNAIQATVGTGMTHFTNQSGSEKIATTNKKIGRGPYQLTDKDIEAIPINKAYSPVGGRPYSNGGDVYFHPDNLLWECNMIATMTKSAGFTSEQMKENPDVALIMAGCGQQSTSSSGIKPFFGANNFGGSYTLSSLIDTEDSRYSELALEQMKQTSKILQRCSDAVVTYENPKKCVELFTDYPAYMEYFFQTAMIDTDGWYFTQKIYDIWSTLGQRSQNTIKFFWKVLHGSEASWSDILAKMKAKTKTYSGAINAENGTNYSFSDVAQAYGVSTDGIKEAYEYYYDGSKYLHHGALIYVGKERSSIYKHKYTDGSDPFLTIAINSLLVRNFAGAGISGKFVYGSLLKLAGVGVDISKPETYLEGLTPNTFVPANDSAPTSDSENLGSVSMDKAGVVDLKWIKENFGETTTRGLTEGTAGSVKRKQYISIAYSRTLGNSLLYSQAYRMSTKYADCSSFVERCLYELDTGSFQMPGRARDTRAMYNNAVSKAGGSEYQLVLVNNVLEAKSGDILWYKQDPKPDNPQDNNYHVVIIIGFNEKADKLLVAHASNNFKSTKLTDQVKTAYYHISISTINRKLLHTAPDSYSKVPSQTMCIIRPKIFNAT